MYRINMEEIDRIVRVYCDLTEGCKAAVRDLLDEVVSQARATRYMPLVNLANDLARFYGEDVREYLLRQFEEWQEGDAGFLNHMKAIHAGSDAESLARRKEDEMRDALEDMFMVWSGGLSIDTSDPTIGEQDFAELASSYLARCVKRIEEAYEQARSYMRSMSEENDVARLIEDVVNTTGRSLRDVFSDAKDRVDEGQETFSIGVKRSQSALTGGSTIVDHAAVTKLLYDLIDL